MLGASHWNRADVDLVLFSMRNNLICSHLKKVIL